MACSGSYCPRFICFRWPLPLPIYRHSHNYLSNSFSWTRRSWYLRLCSSLLPVTCLHMAIKVSAFVSDCVKEWLFFVAIKSFVLFRFRSVMIKKFCCTSPQLIWKVDIRLATTRCPSPYATGWNALNLGLFRRKNPQLNPHWTLTLVSLVMKLSRFFWICLFMACTSFPCSSFVC